MPPHSRTPQPADDKAKLTYVGGEIKIGKLVRGSGPHDTEPVLIESRRTDRPVLRIAPARDCQPGIPVVVLGYDSTGWVESTGSIGALTSGPEGQRFLSRHRAAAWCGRRTPSQSRRQGRWRGLAVPSKPAAVAAGERRFAGSQESSRGLETHWTGIWNEERRSPHLSWNGAAASQPSAFHASRRCR